MWNVIASKRISEIDWKVLEGPEWFPYTSDERKTMVLPAKPPSVRRSAGRAGVRDGGQPEVNLTHREKSATHRMSRKYGLLSWSRYLADGTNVKAIFTLKE